MCYACFAKPDLRTRFYAEVVPTFREKMRARVQNHSTSSSTAAAASSSTIDFVDEDPAGYPLEEYSIQYTAVQYSLVTTAHSLCSPLRNYPLLCRSFEGVAIVPHSERVHLKHFNLKLFFELLRTRRLGHVLLASDCLKSTMNLFEPYDYDSVDCTVYNELILYDDPRRPDDR